VEACKPTAKDNSSYIASWQVLPGEKLQRYVEKLAVEFLPIVAQKQMLLQCHCRNPGFINIPCKWCCRPCG